MIINFQNFLTEKLGISDDVILLVNFLLPLISNKKDIIIDDIPLNTSFKINKISIKFINKKNIKGGFNESKSKLTKNKTSAYLREPHRLRWASI